MSFLLPKRLHQDFYNVYSFCRWADDLGDEIGDPRESLRLLDWWDAGTRQMYAGETRHPVFVALRPTAERYELPPRLFLDLIRAFVQDQTVTRYDNWAGVLDYCVYSANPVGRLLLYLFGHRDPERQALSDYTCTALQLANHWQDVSVDLLKGRIYVPREVLLKHGADFDDLVERRFTEGVRKTMVECVEAARDLFRKGLPLSRMVDRRLGLDVELFSRGGMKILDKVEAQGYNVLARRPRISKMERVTVLLGAFARWSVAQRVA